MEGEVELKRAVVVNTGMTGYGMSAERALYSYTSSYHSSISAKRPIGPGNTMLHHIAQQ